MLVTITNRHRYHRPNTLNPQAAQTRQVVETSRPINHLMFALENPQPQHPFCMIHSGGLAQAYYIPIGLGAVKK